MKDQIVKLLREGKTYNEIVAEVGCSKATISYHACKIGMPRGIFKRHDWTQVQAYVDEGHTRIQCIRYFGIAMGTWDKALKRGDVVIGDWRTPLETLLVVGRKTNRVHLKDRLIKAGLLEKHCYNCGIVDWLGKPLTLQLEHKNGVNNDNRLENLELLCPNCHSQTSTFAGRNVKLRKIMMDGQAGKAPCSEQGNA